VRQRAALLALVVLLASACASDHGPSCENDSVLVLMAQSVPDASMVPCLEALPAGWFLSAMDVNSGGSRFWLDSDRAGLRAVEVSLAPDCEVTGAVEVPSDEEGAQRYEEIATFRGRFRGSRHYVFEGGCVTYAFEFTETGQTALVHDMSQALTFRTRADLAADLRERSGGRLDEI
jgi:hypothetical protein